jgi:hyperosmotically inducible protein
MKKTPLLFASCAALFTLAGCGQPPAPNAEPTAAEKAELAVKNAVSAATAKTKEVAKDVKDLVATKLVEWHLTPEEIKAELERTGRVVRAKTDAAVAKSEVIIDNARVVAVIKTKLVGDPQLSARQITVVSEQGIVTISGTVPSAELIGRAITLALETEGVTQVVSLLTVSGSG